MTSGGKHFGNRVVIASIILVVALLLAQAVTAYFLPAKAVMHLNGERFEVRIADNDRDRKKGLSGTNDLPKNEALVFIFDHDGRHGIWMKDMNYAIDIVWLDSERRVVHIKTNALPESYPNESFYPKSDARYVVEFRSGIVEDKGIRIGQEAIFSGTSRQI